MILKPFFVFLCNLQRYLVCIVPSADLKNLALTNMILDSKLI